LSIYLWDRLVIMKYTLNVFINTRIELDVSLTRCNLSSILLDNKNLWFRRPSDCALMSLDRKRRGQRARSHYDLPFHSNVEYRLFSWQLFA